MGCSKKKDNDQYKFICYFVCVPGRYATRTINGLTLWNIIGQIIIYHIIDFGNSLI